MKGITNFFHVYRITHNDVEQNIAIGGLERFRGSSEPGQLLETIAMMKLGLANEYLAGPIFCPEPDAMGHIDVDDLPLS